MFQVPFIRRREPIYDRRSVPVEREFGNERITGVPGIPDPVREADFEGRGMRRSAQLFTSFAPFAAFGSGLGMEAFSGRAYQPDPSAAYPYGELSVDAPRKVVARPPSRQGG